MTSVDQLRITRRNRKGHLTRVLKELFHLIERNGSLEEIATVKAKAKTQFERIEECHDNLVEQIKGDEDYEKEQDWMLRCQDEYNGELARLEVMYVEKKELKSDVVPKVEVNVSSKVCEKETDLNVTNETCDNDSVTTNGNVDGNFVGLFKTLTLAQNQIKHYGGDPLHYHAFISAFNNTVLGINDDNIKLNSLLSLCCGKALQSIQYCVLKNPSEGLQSAFATLKERFGNPAIIVQAWIEKVLKRNRVDPEKILEFSDDLGNCYETLSALGYLNELNNQSSLKQIIDKLPKFLQNRWQHESYRLRESGVMPNLENVVKFIKAAAKEITDPVFGNAHNYQTEVQPRKRTQVHSIRSSAVSGTATGDLRDRSPKCWICRVDSHWLDQCEKFHNMNVHDRFKLVKSNHACFSCLKVAGRNHRLSNCSRRKLCTEKDGEVQCERFHHKLLHVPKSIGIANLSLKGQDEPLLCVLDVKVKSKNGDHTANVMLDLGSQGTFVRTEFVKRLGIKGKDVTASITKVGGSEETHDTRLYDLKLCGDDPYVVHDIQALEMDNINDVGEVNVNDLDKCFKMPKAFKRSGGPIDILIGVDYAYLMTGETKKMNGLIALKSPLGWTAFGGKTNEEISNRVMNVKINKPVDLTDFWLIESMGIDVGNCNCKAKQRVLDNMEGKLISESSSKVGGQWMIPYPWAKNPNNLINNRAQAVKMLQGLESRLKKNDNHAKAYQKQIEEMITRGFARKLSESELKEYSGPVHYLPHHGVVRPESKSTPLRIVFNSANKCNGESINDYWIKGPDLLNNLNGVLMRFREREVAISGDISKMYNRVLIPEMDQHVHRFLWRDLDGSRNPDTYVMLVLTFGDKPAPAMAQTALRLTAEESANSHPKAADVLKNQVYMDDICTSVRTSEEARMLTDDLDLILHRGGFTIKEWLSNKSLRDKDIIIEQAEQKVLGVLWDRTSDTLSVKIKLKELIFSEKLTKRKVLGVMAKIYDPIGLLTPIVVKLKIQMQELWEASIGWDEVLPVNVQAEWKRLFEELKYSDEVKFPRCLTPVGATEEVQLLIFCDASERAYGACAYLRWKLCDGTFETKFVTAKSRVAPLKKLTIPRLELQSTVMAARMGKSVIDETSLPLTNVLYFTDSMIVLSWLKKPSCCYKQFVATRVLEVQNKTRIEDWRHVPGADNPADDVSRGIAVTNLNGRWMTGPNFLKSPIEEWNQGKLQIEEDDGTENKLVKFSGSVEIKQVQPEVNIESCCTWEEVLEIYRRQIYGEQSPALDVHQVRDIEFLLLRRVQRESFAEELQCLQKGQQVHKSSRLVNLDPELDTEHNLIRVGGRLRNLVSVDIDNNPVLLAPKHHITNLLISRIDANVFNHSAGPNQVYAYIRRKYWILKGRGQVKSMLNRCTECQKWRKGFQTQKMAVLPEARLRIGHPPFYSTGMDCWGPMFVKVRRSQEKRWGIVFKCMTTRALHLEIIRSMDVDAFIMAFRRFVARRGVPREVFSDCGTNFKGAERELADCFQAMSPELQQKLAQQQVEFKFNPPNAPHFGGIWEREIKSVKNALRCCLKERVVSEVVLHTVIVEVEGLLNSKPLGYTSSDVADADPVTPNMLLMGRRDPSLPFAVVNHREQFQSKRQWRHSQLIIDMFWKKFVAEYLPSLQIRQKWVREVENLKIGDKVLVADGQADRGDWPVGVICEICPSDDDRVRVVMVKIKGKVYKRPVVKLVKLEEWV